MQPLFTPSQEEVRRFFCEVYRKYLENTMLTPMEIIARDWIVEHPEYHQVLADADTAVARNYSIDDGQTNPFLHLSMHLSIAEQLSINQPAGVCQAFNQLLQRTDSHHAAHHQMMECLGEMLWHAQRNNAAPDAAVYLECLQRS